MNATITRGRRILAVVATTSTLLLPAVGASAAPAEQANERAAATQTGGDEGSDRAAEAHATNDERAEARPEREAPEPRSSQRDAEVTEDNDPHDNDGEDRPNTPDVNGDDDNQHPSGKDKSAESGNSGNQGNAQHDPDDDGNGPDRSNGGLDQPGGQGGDDLDDQDGNNGCGNDDDFEDDNEGLCGGNPDRGPKNDASLRADTTPPPADNTTSRVNPISTTTPGVEVPQPTLEGVVGVMGVMGERVELEDETLETAVLGVTLTNEVEAATTGGILAAALPAQGGSELAAAEDALPRTGAGLAGLAAFGLSALAGGTALSRRRA